MSAKIIDGKKNAQEIREELKKEVESLKKEGITPSLTVFSVGDIFTFPVLIWKS